MTTEAIKTKEARVARAKELLKQNPGITHVTANETIAAEFGIGIDFYLFKGLKTGKLTRRIKRRASKHSGSSEDRKDFVRKLMRTIPGISNSAIQKKLREQFNSGIGNNIVTELRKEVMSSKTFTEKVFRNIKTAMKKDTVPLKSPLKNELKNIGKLLTESGVEQASMTIVDGVPRWKITETRTYEM